MAEGKKSVLIYVEWIGIFEELSDEEAGKLIKHLFRYVNDKNPEAPDRITKLLFEPIKQALKRDLIKYEEKRNKNRENVLIRWNKKDTNEYERIKTDTNYTDKDNVKVNDKDKDIFKRPSIKEIKDYCEERKNNVDPVKWLNFYESKGWMVGRNKMKDWKACIRTWEKDDKPVKVVFGSKKIDLNNIR